MAEEEAQPAEENAEATEATEATADAAAEAPAEAAEAPKPQSVWLPIMASSIISIGGAFALFHFVLADKLVSGVANVLKAEGSHHADSSGGEDKGDKDDHGEKKDDHGEKKDDHGEKKEDGATTDPNVDDSKGPIPIVSEEESIVINPAGSGGTRYLLVEIYLVRDNEKDKAFKAAIDANSKKLQSITRQNLMEHDIKALTNPNTQKLIENKLKKEYQSVLGYKDHPIKELVVTRWIMQ